MSIIEGQSVQVATREADGLPTPRRYWSIFSIALAMAAAVLVGAIANVALPTISQEFGVSASSSLWVLIAYQLAVTVSLLPLASLGEILGYRRIYLVGLVIFIIASAGCAFSSTLLSLAIWRALQGVGAAGVMGINAALVRFTYPHSLLGRGIGINAVVVAVSSALGPTMASAVLAATEWRWLFAVNVPVGLLALVIGWRSLPSNPLSQHKFDTVSALFCVLFFGLFVSGFHFMSHTDGSSIVALCFVVSGSAGAALVRRQRSAAAPLLPMDLLRIPSFALSIGTSICSFLAQMLAYASLPFLLQTQIGFTAVQAGLLITPWPLATAVTAIVAGRLADRYNPGLICACGLAFVAIGLAALAQLASSCAMLDVSWRMALTGCGFGLFQVPNNRLMIGSTPRERVGGASGMLSTARLLGQTVGAACAAAILAHFGSSGPATALEFGAATAVLAAFISCIRLLPAPV